VTTTRALTRKFPMHNLLLALALLASLALRLWRIDEFISVDEHNWRTRSIEFYQGLVSGDYLQTCRTEHPGVLTMWAGVVGYRIAGRLEGVQIKAPWLRAGLYPRGDDQGVGLYPETLWARRIIALTTWLGIVGLYLLGRRFLPPRVNLAATSWVALDPFYLAFSRLHHLDGLLACFMALSLWALLAYGQRSRPGLLALSGAMAGLATLNKAPGITLALAAVALLGWYAWRDKRPGRGWFWRWANDVLIWSGAAVLVGVALWPAMWNSAAFAIRRVAEGALRQASNPHEKGNFFLGVSLADPGWGFYPVAWALRTTPLVMLGLAALALLRPMRGRRTPMVVLVAFSVGYALLMSLSLKKFDRYLLPVFPLLCAPAGAGLAALAERIAARWPGARWLAPAGAIGAIGLYLAMALPAAPYYTAYYNPLLGGVKAAPRMLLVGWGEGLEQAAAYLNAKPNAAKLHVASMSSSEFEPFFSGRTTEASETILVDPDYFVTYASHVQRHFVPELLQQLDGQEPEFVARASNGLAYAWVYPNRIYRQEIDDLLAQMAARPREELVLLNTSALAVRSSREVHSVITERRDYMLTELEWLSSQYDAVWFLSFPGIHDASTAALRHSLEIHARPAETIVSEHAQATRFELADGKFVWPAGPYARLCQVGPDIEFRGHGRHPEAVQPGGQLNVLLYWRAKQALAANYKVFLHLVGEGETIVAQSDSEPQGSTRPTSRWQQGQMVLDSHTLSVPADTLPGDYALYVGMYDPATMQRLPIVDESGQRVSDDRLLIAAVDVSH
jgi:hypothetical protein